MENYKNSKIGLETAQKYGDIIEMERPQTEESLRKHPRMTLQNRAKIFSPFAALRGYDEQLAAEKQRTERVPKRILTEEEMSALSDRLMQVTKGMTITVRYFKEDTAHPEVPAVGNYITLTGKADRIDPVFRTLQVGDTVVPFEDLVEISGEGIMEIDQFDFLESLYQPIVSGAVIGAILGDLPTGLIVGGTYQLMTIGNMPVGGAQPPNAVIGGVMATVFAISSHLDTTAAVGLAVPFALIGQYMVTFLFTLMSPMMSKADQLAAKGDTKGIVRLNYLAMALLGLLFAIVCTLGMLGGSAMGTTLSNLAAKYAWVMAGLGAAGGMMRFVGFATLLRIMLSNEFWGIYFAGFALATIIGYIPELSGSALLLIAFVGIAIALYDYQTRVAIKQAAGSGFAANGGDDEDGI